MKRHTTIIAAVLLLVLLLAACGASREPAYDQGVAERAPAMEESVVAMPNLVEGAPTQADTMTPDLQMMQETRKIIYNADMSLVVEDTEASVKQIADLAERLGGYVASMNAYRREDSMVYDITIRVPADEFETGLSSLRSLAVRVESENLGTNDVTDEYYDLDARLKTMKEAEAELTELLRQTREQGGSVEDVMAVYDRLMQLRADIESLQGQLNRLEKLVAFSTISLHLEPSVLSKPIEGSGWHPLETARKSLDTLVDVLAGLGSFFIWFMIVVVPVLLILILPLALVVWLLLRWRKRRHVAHNPQE